MQTSSRRATTWAVPLLEDDGVDLWSLLPKTVCGGQAGDPGAHDR
jgi:hypothetical protein